MRESMILVTVVLNEVQRSNSITLAIMAAELGLMSERPGLNQRYLQQEGKRGATEGRLCDIGC
jgi:hypothetical protein